MTFRLARPLAATLAAGVIATLAGCGAAPLGGERGQAVATVAASTVPSVLAGLTVTAEPVGKVLRHYSHLYIDQFGFFGLRAAHQLEATLEIADFGPAARLDQASFRSSILADVSPGIPSTVNIAGQAIEQAQGLKSIVSAWFSGRSLLVLTVLDSYGYPRQLLEAVVREVRP